jgi:hypothetical protein
LYCLFCLLMLSIGKRQDGSARIREAHWHWFPQFMVCSLYPSMQLIYFVSQVSSRMTKSPHTLLWKPLLETRRKQIEEVQVNWLIGNDVVCHSKPWTQIFNLQVISE